MGLGRTCGCAQLTPQLVSVEGPALFSNDFLEPSAIFILLSKAEEFKVQVNAFLLDRN